MAPGPLLLGGGALFFQLPLKGGTIVGGGTIVENTVSAQLLIATPEALSQLFNPSRPNRHWVFVAVKPIGCTLHWSLEELGVPF